MQDVTRSLLDSLWLLPGSCLGTEGLPVAPAWAQKGLPVQKGCLWLLPGYRRACLWLLPGYGRAWRFMLLTNLWSFPGPCEDLRRYHVLRLTMTVHMTVGSDLIAASL